MKRNFTLMLAVLLLLTLFAACTKTPATLTTDKKALTFNAAGDTAQLTATLSGSDEEIFWVSSDEKIATVDDKGLVTAVANGSCSITATAGDLSAKCNVICKWKESIDLTAFYNNIAESYELGKLMELTDDLFDSIYIGLDEYNFKQKVAYMPAMSAIVSEYVFVECENANDVSAVVDILQKRIDDQAAGGAWYPESVEAWSKAQVVTNGSYVALIASVDNTDAIADDFNSLFK